MNSWMGTALGKVGYCPRNCIHLRDDDSPRYGYSPMNSDSLKDGYHPRNDYNSRDGDRWAKVFNIQDGCYRLILIFEIWDRQTDKNYA